MGSGSDGEKPVKVKVKAEPEKEEKTKVHQVAGAKGGDGWGKGKGKGKGKSAKGDHGYKGAGPPAARKGGGKCWKGTWDDWGSKEAKDARDNRYDYDFKERERRVREKEREKEAKVAHELEADFFDQKFSNQGHKGFKGGKKGGKGGKGGKRRYDNNEDITGFDINEKPPAAPPVFSDSDTSIRIEDEEGQVCTVALEDGVIVLHLPNSDKKRTVTQVKFYDETKHLQFKCKEVDWHMALPESYAPYMGDLQAKLATMVKKASEMAKEAQEAAERQAQAEAEAKRVRAAQAEAEAKARAAAAANPHPMLHAHQSSAMQQPLLQTRPPASFAQSHQQHPQHPQQSMFPGASQTAPLGSGMFSNPAMRAHSMGASSAMPSMQGMSAGMSGMQGMSGMSGSHDDALRRMQQMSLQQKQQQQQQQQQQQGWPQAASKGMPSGSQMGWPSQQSSMGQGSSDFMKMMSYQMKPQQPAYGQYQHQHQQQQQQQQQRASTFAQQQQQQSATPFLMNPITGMGMSQGQQKLDKDFSTDY